MVGLSCQMLDNLSASPRGVAFGVFGRQLQVTKQAPNAVLVPHEARWLDERCRGPSRISAGIRALGNGGQSTATPTGSGLTRSWLKDSPHSLRSSVKAFSKGLRQEAFRGPSAVWSLSCVGSRKIHGGLTRRGSVYPFPAPLDGQTARPDPSSWPQAQYKAVIRRRAHRSVPGTDIKMRPLIKLLSCWGGC